MPPRKSNASQITTTAEETTPSKERDGVNIEDLSLPRTMVQRLAKGVLPPNTQIQKDAITAMSKAATVFVSYLSQAANTSAIPTTRKTISPEAVLDALAELEFEDFIPRVQAELRRFNEVQTNKRNEYRRKVKEKEIAENGASGGGGSGGVGGRVVQNGNREEKDNNGERAAKRIRMEANPEATNGVSVTETGKGAVTEDEEEVEEQVEDEEEAGKDDDTVDEDTEEEEEEGDESGDDGGQRSSDLEEVDDADLDERAADEEDEEGESGEDSE